jgi:hypothetical protein
MPLIDDIYGPAVAQEPRAVAVVQPGPPVTALTRFSEDPAGLKDAALSLLAIKVRPVETAEAAGRLAEQRANVKLILKDIEVRRKLIVEPLKKEAAAVDAEAHRWTDPLMAWDKDAERALLAFQRLQEDRRRREEEARQAALVEAARRQAEAEAAGKKEEAEAASVEIMKAEAAPVRTPVTGFRTDSGTTSKRSRWVVEVVNAELVPSRYLVPDTKALQAAVDAGAREIEGCSIREVDSLPVRTRG